MFERNSVALGRERLGGQGHRGLQAAADRLDRDRRTLVGGGQVAVAAIDVREDRERVLEVVEDDQHVGEHQRMSGRPS